MNYHPTLEERMNGPMGMNIGSRRENMSPEKAQFIVDQKKANEGLKILDELQSSYNYNYDLQEQLRNQSEENSKQRRIIEEFVKTFWEYKIKELSWMRRSCATESTEIIMPINHKAKFFNKIFCWWVEPYRVPAWKTIKVSIDILDSEYEIESIKVAPTKIKKEKKVIPKTTAKWKTK